MIPNGHLGKDVTDHDFEGKRCYPTASTCAVHDKVVYGPFLNHTTLAMCVRSLSHFLDAGRAYVIFSIKVGRHGFNSRPPLCLRDS